MSLSLFSTKNNYWRNGLNLFFINLFISSLGVWWFTKIANRALGENRYEFLRIQRRIWGNRMFYTRQQLITEIFVESPELAGVLGMYPKGDNTHGFPNYASYEMYRDFQENTINSDGWFGMWFVVIAAFYFVHFTYSYMIPFYWTECSVKNEEETRLRIKDVLSSSVLEEVYGNQYAEWAWQPHDHHYMRIRGYKGYTHPDDPRAMHMTTFNRKNKYKEHYMLGPSGDQAHMSFPGQSTHITY